MKQIFFYLLFVLGGTYCSILSAKNVEYTFESEQGSYQYSIVQTGDNYTFKFDKNPEEEQLKAGYHVLHSTYKDDTINKKYSESYIRERARCYVFDSRFHTYSLCFLPNDFNKEKKDRFWGFVTQVPNWKWLLTRFFLPVALLYALLFYVVRRRKG